MLRVNGMFLSIVLILLTQSVYAQDAQAEAQERQMKYDEYTERNHLSQSEFRHRPDGRWEMGVSASYFTYEEPDIMEDQGPFGGVYANYTYRTQENERLSSFQDFFSEKSTLNMFRFEGSLAYGQVDYESVNTGSIDNIDDFLAEARLLGGYDLPMNETVVTPFFGLGYRYLNDDSSGMLSTTGHGGYERESNYFYIPIGVSTKTPIGNGWKWGATVEYDIFAYGKQISHLGDADSVASTIENEQDSGYGARASLRLEKETEKLTYVIEPYYRMWQVDDSDTDDSLYSDPSLTDCGSSVCLGSFYEPDNEQWEAGVKVGVIF